MRASTPDVAEVGTVFCSWVHAAGVPMSPERIARFCTALSITTPTTIDELRWTARVTLASTRTQWSTLDAVIDQVFGGRIDDLTRGAPGSPSIPRVDATAPSPTTPKKSEGETFAAPGGRTSGGPARTGAAQRDDRFESERVEMTASVEERLGGRDFAAVSSAELVELAALIRGLTVVAPRRKSHRRRRCATGTSIDLRRTLRTAHRTAGDPVHFAHRDFVERPRRVVLLADVSGSMERYARAYLYLLHATVRAVGSEAFLFSTRLTRVTTLLRVSSPEVALHAAASAAPDWSGGTRIGTAIESFLDGWGRRGMARGAVVVILSDGWEAGSPEMLGEQMARLSRLAHRIVWVNPRRADVRYQPLVGGMAAALPYVDAFVSGHSVDAMRDLLKEIAR